MSNKGNGGPYSMMGGPNGPKGPNGRGAVARAAPNEALLGHAASAAPPVVTGIRNMVANLKRRQANVTRRKQEANRRKQHINNGLKSRRNTYFTQRAAELTRSPPRNHTIINVHDPINVRVGSLGGSKRRTKNRRRR